MPIYERNFVSVLKERLGSPDLLIQTVLGPRQVGKTTGVLQLIESRNEPSLYASADDVLGDGGWWIREKWQEAAQKADDCLLVLDEIQKIENWAETVKALWDQQQGRDKIKVVLLGSSSLKIQSGLTESLAGRFELLSVGHWSFEESNKIKKMTLNEYLRYGGYPGSYKFIEDQPRWRNYLINSIIDSVINKDILSNAVVKKPALFRQLFNILSSYPSQEISYRKLLGQMQDKGNTEVIKYYISLYEGAFLFKGIPKFSNQAHKVKTSSPKVIPLAPCFYNIAEDSDEKLSWVFESIVGADLIKKHNQVYYWRDGNYEVDFVYKEQGTIFAVEVKSGRKKNPRGLEAFLKKFPSAETKFISQDSFRC